MKTCDREWCDEEIHVPIGPTTAVAHRAVVSTVNIAGDEVSVVLAAIDDGPTSVLIEAQEAGCGSTTVVTSTGGSDACKLAAGLLDAVDRASIRYDQDGDGGHPMWDVERLRGSLRDHADAERHKYGSELRTGPFDDSPLGLLAQVSNNFTAPADHNTTAAWLLVVLAEHKIETGHIDREIAREVTEVLGPDAIQVLGGWVARSQPREVPPPILP